MVKVNVYSQILKTKLFKIEAGKLVCVLNKLDAAELGVVPGDRVEIKNKRTKKERVRYNGYPHKNSENQS